MSVAGAVVELLLAQGASPWRTDCHQRLPLHFAAEAGHAACVRLLVSAMRQGGGQAGGGAADGTAPGEARDQNGQTPVQLAAEHGLAECVALLLDSDGTGEAGWLQAVVWAAPAGKHRFSLLVCC
jgi:ankyrin repeat protein